MIITVENLRSQVDCGSATDEQIAVRLRAIEGVIRAYTNNNFQLREVRFTGMSQDNKVYGNPQYFTVGDTVQISGSLVNNGMYQVVSVDEESIELDGLLFNIDFNMVTKIYYPDDVVQCAVELYRWKQNMGDKVGIKSETLSRHSVTYEDSSSLYMGYPTGILNGLDLYKKARC